MKSITISKIRDIASIDSYTRDVTNITNRWF
ncbi:hypothetical protein SAMN05216285_1520 [Natrinema salifodinae]|uniref:Uncharacterized protein n=1 Tax=Natrinema salifodinae TaxID=1202768 RepID=A0A1I0NB49_9EURY|nr:hypothetical protein SAMN05216285_1520 [Natrinema salifodinae]